MKKNLLPTMQKIKMKDTDGVEFAMSIEVRSDGEKHYVFVSDTHQLGVSRLAQNAVFYFDKICRRLHLDAESTVFYRHIYQEHMGSLFGRFKVDWKANPEPSYKFQMLTNIDDLQSVNRLLNMSTKIGLEDLCRSNQPVKHAASA